ncbi:hypothetical protein B0T18DRAFT_427271 [Schizothecium vesticola]|uniref:NAD(P)-binding protein n=1 Tax=Schizothecium vesticola TaxID=314040 RepID=A0AA40K7R0_9PEZI|nr:hypothetical protein B0T18DRAFT_427271 [Schizothecium vesticola]
MSTKSAAAASHDEFNRNSLFNMKGRVALVTGGGSGIGLMATQALAVNGAKVYIVGRDKSKLDRVVSTYNKDIEGEIIALQGDVTSKSDAASVHLTRMLAAEASENEIKVRINSIAPGVFPSEMTAEESDDYQKSHVPAEKYAQKVPAQRPGRDVDMAQAVLMIVANQYVSGQTIVVDGGYTLAAGL